MKRLGHGLIAAALAASMLTAAPACGPPRVEPRVFAVGLKQDLASVVGYSSYGDRMAEIMAAVAPDLSANRPNLVVFPEETGLAAAYIGSRGEAAREQSDIMGAFATLGLTYAPQALFFILRYPRSHSALLSLEGLC